MTGLVAFTKQRRVALLAGVVALTLAALPAHAQYRTLPSPHQNRPAPGASRSTGPVGVPSPTPGPIIHDDDHPHPWHGGPWAWDCHPWGWDHHGPCVRYPSFHYVYYFDPASYLYGTAAVLNSLGELNQASANADLTREQVAQAKIDTRRKAFDQRRYEQMNTPTLEDIRAQERMNALRRAVSDPPLTEILSGRSLNDILASLKQAQAYGVQGPTVALNEEQLRCINVTVGERGNVGLLRNDGRLTWPPVLQDPAFAVERGRLDQLLPEAVQQARSSGQVNAALLKQLVADTARLQEKLSEALQRDQMPPTGYIEARRYLTQLDEAVTALHQPGVGAHLNQKYAPRGQTVAELVRHMADAGARFAPATQGDTAAYRALHQKLVEYHLGLQQLARR